MRRPHPTTTSVCLLLAAALLACSGDGGAIIDAREPDADAAVDAAVDVPDAPDPSELTLDPAFHDFGSVMMSRTSAPAEFMVTNTGAGATGAITIRFTGTHAGDFSAGSCNDLAPGASCTVTVVFAPQGVDARLANLEISAANGGARSALLQGTGQPAAPRLEIAPTPLGLGNVRVGDTSAPGILTVTNVGAAASGPLSISLANGDVGDFVREPPLTGDCTSTTQLATDESCTVRVRFAPTEQGGRTVQLVASAVPGNTATASISGVGLAEGAAALVLLPPDAAFGNVAVGQPSAGVLFTVTNSGTTTSSTVSALSSSPRFTIAADSCTGNTLDIGHDCTFQVVYTPVIAGGAGGLASDAGTITVSAAMGGTVTSDVTGTGTATLAVVLASTGGGGRVTSSPSGIDCTSGTCGATFASNTVTLTAVAAAGSGFAGWTGACAQEVSTTCAVTMDAARTVGASFVPLRRLTVVASGGTVTSAPAGVSCPGDCTQDYNHGTMVMLSATPAPGYRLGAWSEPGCSGPICTVTMDMARTVTASFVRQYTLTVNARDLGVASGSSVTVTPSMGSPATCAAVTGAGAPCQYVFDAGSDVVLSRTLGASTSFQGWGADCTGTGGCGPLVMSQDRTVNASFAAYRVVITIQGGGKVAIAPTTSGALCPDDSCTPIFPGDASVTLTPQPDAGAAFWGWGAGSCTGTAACSLSMTANMTALAEFRTARVLTVTKSGAGAVASSPAGIDCGAGCTSQSAAFPDGRTVTLTATPAFGYERSGWTGACAGTAGATCTVTMSAARSAGVTFSPGADLTVTSVTCTPDPIAPGAALTCSATVRNAGTAPAGAFTNRLVLSADATIDGADPQLGTCAVSGLAAGASTTVSCSGTIAGSTAAGPYHAGVIADSAGVVPESNESNNTGADAVTVTRPDLTVSAVSCAPEPAAPGATVTCSVSFANAGPAAGAFAYDLRLSTDTTIDATSDGLIATCTLAGGIPAGGSQTTSCSGPLPPALGPHHVGVIADRGGAITETDETNNTRATPIRIGTDLVLSALACTDSQAPGGDATCTFTVTNEGTAVGPFTLGVHLSTDANVSSSDPLLGSCHSTGLAAGATSTASCTVAVPAAQAVGSYHLGVVADSADVIAEWDFSGGSNNAQGEPFVVLDATGTDLAISALTCTPSLVAPGAPMPCTVTVANRGPDAAAAFTIALRHGSFQVGSTDPIIGSCAVAGLPGGATATLPCNATAPTSVGSRRISAWADSGGAVAESSETNNESSELAFTVAGTTPDLDVIAMSCPDLATSGAAITCDVTILNRGTNGTVPFANRIVRSTDSTITTTDTPGADCNATAGIAGLEELTLSCTLTLTGVGAGSPYIGFILDTGANVVESSETNNTGYDQIQVVANGIDLDPDAALSRCTAGRVAQGGAVYCRVVVQNRGATAAPASRTGLSVGGVQIGDCPTPAIAARGAATFDCAGTIPLGMAPGTSTISMTADYNLQLAESNEGNNSDGQPVTILVGTAELVADSITCANTGGSASCVVQVSNTGGAAAGPFRLSIRQSTNSTITTSDPEVASCTPAGLGPAATSTYRCDFTLVDRSAYMGVFVDADNVITESVETNNLATVTVAWRIPNLDITSFSCTRSSSTGIVTCNVTVANTSTDAASGPFDLTIRLSSNTTYEATDPLIATTTMGSLAPGTSQAITVTGPSPDDNYAVGMVDALGVVPETSETDNTAYDPI